MIGAAHLDAALEIVRYSNDSVRCIFGDRTGDTSADTILLALRARPDGMTRTEINHSLFSRNVAATKIAAALAELLDAGKVRVERGADTGGRPAERFFVV
jgi:hypothetical protein